MIFQGVRTPCPPPPPPSGSPHGMHLKEGTCLKCSFQRVVIIGRKVGLDYNSWYACFAPDQARRTCLQTLIAGRKSRERERERERDCTVFAHESFLGQSINLPTRTQNPNLSCASAFVRQSRTFHSITCNALRTFYRMHTFLN